ncbi:MAG: PQQ-dependent sugar dehydrogenase, partial [Ferruginibacter sp.]
MTLLSTIKKNLLLIVIGALLQLYSLSSCNSVTSSDTIAIATDSLTITNGQHFFTDKCNSCHNLNSDGIGPALAGITKKNSVEWIKHFIRDPKKVIDSGDTTAQKVFRRYKTLMPSFESLPEDELDAIIAYIHSNKKKVKGPVKEDIDVIKNPIPDSIATSDLLVDLQLITQIPASSDQAPISRICKLDYQPNTGDLYVLDLRGKLYKLQDGQSKLYMDMAALKPAFIHQPGMGTGFGSFAFHPAFAKNGLLYTTHTEPPATAKADFNYPDSIPVKLQWILTEWKTDPAAFPFSGMGREIFRIDMPTGIHGLQEIAFNPLAKPGSQDYGLLYICVGDGGSTEIGHALVSQIPQTIWGSIIRIDPSGKNSSNGHYGIPPYNPFSKPSDFKKAPEVYAYGFRNPHRISWSKSGQLLAVNIGEHNIESINLIKAGNFYGW